MNECINKIWLYMQWNMSLKRRKFWYIYQMYEPWGHYAKWNKPVTKGQILYDFTYEVSRVIKEKAMAPHPSTLAWKIPWMEEPGRLQSMGLLRVGHDWATSLSLFTFMHWRRKWQPTPIFLPGESQGQRNLVGCRLWGHTESDTTEVT